MTGGDTIKDFLMSIQISVLHSIDEVTVQKNIHKEEKETKYAYIANFPSNSISFSEMDFSMVNTNNE